MRRNRIGNEDDPLTSTEAGDMRDHTAVLFGHGGTGLLDDGDFSGNRLFGDDRLHAAPGNSHPWGGTGDDFFEGRAGNHVLFGSSGADTFVFHGADETFESANDVKAMTEATPIDGEDSNATYDDTDAGPRAMAATGTAARSAETSAEIRPWHHYVKEFKEALRNDDKKAFADVVDEALGADHILSDGDMLIDGNEHGRSYNSMGQSDMGLALIRAGRQWGVTEWVDDGIAALNVMLTKYGAGGLRLRDRDSETAWYCGQTLRDHEDKGGTLNKHLYATRTFFKAAEEMEALGKMRKAAEYEQAGEEGFLKLVKGKQAPQLKDFFVQKDNGDYYFNSWVYYANNDANREKPYFLGDNKKNASYHLLDMNLIHTIGRHLDDDFKFKPFHKEQLGKISAFGGMLKVYENKLDRGGLDRDTDVPHGQFSSTLNGSEDALHSSVTDWFEPFL